MWQIYVTRFTLVTEVIEVHLPWTRDPVQTRDSGPQDSAVTPCLVPLNAYWDAPVTRDKYVQLYLAFRPLTTT